jgi:polyhydroxyalkanoate synthesis regulator phasin
LREKLVDKRVLIRLSIAMSVGVLLLVNVAATYETYGRDGYLHEKLQAAVEAGKITQEQADRKLDSMANRKTKKWKQWDAESLREKLQAAVEAGKITQEQADEKLEKIHSMKGESWKDRKPNYSRKSIP